MTRPAAHLQRERALYLYLSALQRGDLETMGRVLSLAEQDPVLAREIDELEEHDAAGLPEVALGGEAEQVRELLRHHLPSAHDAPLGPVPLTVGDVVGRLVLQRQVPGVDQAAAAQLRDHQMPIPARLGRRDVLRFAETLGVRASERFWQLFREAALLLGLRHSQHAGLVAARKRTQSRDQKEKP